VAQEFLRAVLADPQVRPLLSDEHFSVDGTLIPDLSQESGASGL
jgi:hypothetical protein